MPVMLFITHAKASASTHHQRRVVGGHHRASAVARRWSSPSLVALDVFVFRRRRRAVARRGRRCRAVARRARVSPSASRRRPPRVIGVRPSRVETTPPRAVCLGGGLPARSRVALSAAAGDGPSDVPTTTTTTPTNKQKLNNNTLAPPTRVCVRLFVVWIAASPRRVCVRGSDRHRMLMMMSRSARSSRASSTP